MANIIAPGTYPQPGSLRLVIQPMGMTERGPVTIGQQYMIEIVGTVHHMPFTGTYQGPNRVWQVGQRGEFEDTFGFGWESFTIPKI